VAELSYLAGLDAALASDYEEARVGLERAAYLFGLLQPVAGNFLGVPEAGERLKEIEDRLAALPG
jgi:hypothetical protein